MDPTNGRQTRRNGLRERLRRQWGRIWSHVFFSSLRRRIPNSTGQSNSNEEGIRERREAVRLEMRGLTGGEEMTDEINPMLTKQLTGERQKKKIKIDDTNEGSSKRGSDENTNIIIETHYQSRGSTSKKEMRGGGTDVFNQLFEEDETHGGHLVRLNFQSTRLMEVQEGSWVNSNWARPYKALMELFRNESSELEFRFIEEVGKTQAARIGFNFLRNQGRWKGSFENFTDELHKLWFTKYQRGGRTSSGFKHVFLGEEKYGGIVNGLHNWLRFALEESDGRIEYIRLINTKEFRGNGKVGWGICISFNWRGLSKSKGSMFVGTSPALEIVLYTICFLLGKGSTYGVEMGGKTFGVQTYSFSTSSGEVIGTAYPIV